MTGTATYERLARLGTATLSGQLVKLGIRRHTIAGAVPVIGRGAVAGPAYTLRFIWGREDVSSSDQLAAPGSFMDAVDQAPAGSVVVVEAHGCADSGLIGDVMALRMKVAGVAGFVTDGAVRDRVGLDGVGLPIWARGVTPPPATCSLFFAGRELPVGVGGVAVFPGDVIVADADGAMVLPQAHVASVLDAAAPTEDLERFIVEQVTAGRRLLGLYPPGPEARAEHERWRAARR